MEVARDCAGLLREVSLGFWESVQLECAKMSQTSLADRRPCLMHWWNCLEMLEEGSEGLRVGLSLAGEGPRELV
jgi:hypothetical protein